MTTLQSARDAHPAGRGRARRTGVGQDAQPGHPGAGAASLQREPRPVRGTRDGAGVLARVRLAGGAAGRDVEAGMATAEYAIATVAAVGFAGLLVVVLRSGEVQELLTGLIRGALTV